AEHEPERVAEAFADENVEPAGPGMRGRQLGQRQRAADREHAADHPGQDREREARDVLGHRMGRSEDAGADDVAGRDRGGGVEADLALELDGRAGGRGCHRHGILRYSVGTVLSSSSMMRSGLMPSASAVKLVTMRCRSTAGATAWTSSIPGA